MVAFRREHFEAFRQLARKEFVSKLQAHLRKEFPAETMAHTPAALGSWIEGGMTRSARYGIVLENDVTRYAEHMVVWGEHFDTTPETNWAGQVLRTRSLDGTKKMDFIAKLGRERRQETDRHAR